MGGQLTDEQFYALNWELIKNTLELFLRPNQQIMVSFEQTFTAVYKCICKMQGEHLFGDTISYVRNYLNQVGVDLQSTNENEFLAKLDLHIKHYLGAADGISKCFSYMDRSFLNEFKNTNLQSELHKLFAEVISDRVINNAMQLLTNLLTVPMGISPAIASSLCHGLYVINPKYGETYFQNFCRYIPKLAPPMTDDEIPAEILAAHQVQQQLQEQGFNTGDQTLKRPADDETNDLDNQRLRN